MDAYERLRSSRRPGESFSEVVRRAVFSEMPPTGAELLAYLRSGASGIADSDLDAAEKAANNDKPPDDPWS
jgi:hypothetical protein